MRRTFQIFLIVAIVILVWAGILFLLSSESVNWRIQSWVSEVRYALNPPQQEVFVPVEKPSPAAPLPTTPPPSPTATIDLSTPSPPPETPTPTATVTLVSTPLPAKATLIGVRHQFQTWNNCGPANLSMALSFWGWQGDQHDTAAVLKPNSRDKNVMLYEMEAFVEQETEFSAAAKVGGDLTTLKAFISAGFPVIAAKGFEGEGFDGWMGHYQTVTGYDDADEVFIIQDSYKGSDFRVGYADFEADWRAFNFSYLVVYPEQRRQQVLDILGLQAYENFNTRSALQRSSEEAMKLSGRDLFFALFNKGTNLVTVQDYAGAAAAYDSAFANYAELPESVRPWRITWYQTGPYFAYYYSGRYQDVVNLASQILDITSEPVLEESYYWRGRAYLALGETESGIDDLQACLKSHPDFSPCVQELRNQGIEP